MTENILAFYSDILEQMAWISLKLIYKLYLNYCEGKKRLLWILASLQSTQNILQVSRIKNLVGRCFEFLQPSSSPRLYEKENT